MFNCLALEEPSLIESDCGSSALTTDRIEPLTLLYGDMLWGGLKPNYNREQCGFNRVPTLF